ncbi:MAG: hypothetical protein BGP06_13500 [Rhizobiales bacterium 65-9]|nr:XRE family transcriptional regulator [Hyphomicrobiales bacterium]OJY36716.1 MAG: hypothetical protein BGP06_13500 [Rhizobiales bacterium 65-9]
MANGDYSSITGRQIGAARVLAGLDVNALAASADVPPDQLRRIETFAGPPTANHAMVGALCEALEKLGVEFIPEGRSGAGVRLRFNRQQTRQIAGWENEGGAAADDDIP